MKNLIIVEGLNCSGKSSYICNASLDSFTHRSEVVESAWVNPIRWPQEKKEQIEDVSSFIMGCFETILLRCNDADCHYFFDRSFISSYIYSSINGYDFRVNTFKYLIELYKPFTTFVLVDTDLNVCKRRWATRNENRDYVKNLEWERMQAYFQNTYKWMKIQGCEIEIVEGV